MCSTAGLLTLTLTLTLTHQQDSHLPLAGLCRPPGAALGPGATGCPGRTSWSRRSTSDPRTRRRSGWSRSPRSARLPTCEQSENFCHHILRTERSKVRALPAVMRMRRTVVLTSCQARECPVGVQILSDLLPQTPERPTTTARCQTPTSSAPRGQLPPQGDPPREGG